MRYVIGFILIFLAGMATVVGIAGFRGHLSRKPPIEIFPDMNRQLKLRPQKPNDFFANGISSQLPPPGTIAAQRADSDRQRPRLSLRRRAGQHRPHHGHDEFCRDQPAARHGETASARSGTL